MSALALLWRHHRLALIGFVLAASVTLFFTARFVVFSVYWADPDHRHQAPEAWMTPRYIAHSWDMNPDEIGQALQAEKVRHDRPTLDAIAKARGVPVQVVLDEVNAMLPDRPDRP